MTNPRIAILDYGMGNLRSVAKALERIGARPELTSSLERIRAVDGLVLPGVGAFPEAMRAVRARGLDAATGERVRAGTPMLGICLGMQLLFERSAELEGATGLGLLEGEVSALDAGDLKLPQIGWNSVRWRRASRLNAGLPDPCAFYHVHTFAPRPRVDGDVLGYASYGGEFATAVERDPIYGVQFHPEKSGEHGLRLLANFAAVCGARGSLEAAA